MRNYRMPISGGKRKDRVFKVCLRMPDDVDEDVVMDYIEAAVCEGISHLRPDHPMHGLDVDTVTVKRNTLKYTEMAP